MFSYSRDLSRNSPSSSSWGCVNGYRMLNVCEDYMVYRGWTYARLDGSTTRPRRALGTFVKSHLPSREDRLLILDIRLFNRENSRTNTQAPRKMWLIV